MHGEQRSVPRSFGKTALTAAGGSPPSGSPFIALGVSRDLRNQSPDIRELAAFVFVGAFCLAVALVMTILTHVPFLDFFDLG